MKFLFCMLLANLFLFGLGNLISFPRMNLPPYDSFIFVLQWPNNICGQRDPLCNAALSKIEKNTMIIRGLWPALASGVHVLDCDTGTTTEVKLEGLTNYASLQQFWPSLTSTSELALWTQAYNKYGHHYVLRNKKTDYSFYFETVINVFHSNGYKTLFKRAFGSEKGKRSYSHDEIFAKIESALGHSDFKMICQRIEGQQRIVEVYVSLGLSFEPMPAKIIGIACPTHVPIIVKFR